MATYKIPYQDLSFAVPDENEVFWTSGDRGTIFVRKGNSIYNIGIQELGRKYLESIGATTGLPPGTSSGMHAYISSTGEVLGVGTGQTQREYGIKELAKQGIDVNSITANYNGGDVSTAFGQPKSATDISIFKAPGTITPGEVITKSISPINPQGADVTSSFTGAISKSTSIEENLARAGGTPEQIAGIVNAPKAPAFSPSGVQIGTAPVISSELKAQITPQSIEQGITQITQGQQGYGASSYTGVSIVDYLNSLGKPSDYNSRAALAGQMGIQNYTGTAEQNTQLLNKLRGQGSVSQLAPEGAISTKTLESGATPYDVPTGGVTGDTAGSIVAGAESTMKSIDDYIKMLTPPETEGQTDLDKLISGVSADMEGLTGRGEAQLAAEEAQGVNALRKSLADVNSQIAMKMAQYNALSTDVEGKAITMQSIIGSQAQIRKAEASEIGLLQAQALGLTGQLDVAQGIADRSVDLKYEDATDAINFRLKQIELLQGQLDKDETIRADAIKLYLADQQNQLSITIQNEKDKNATLLNLLQSYPDAGIKLTDTLESAARKVENNSALYKKEKRIAPTGGEIIPEVSDIFNKEEIARLVTAGVNKDEYTQIATALLGGLELDEIRQILRDAGIDPVVLDRFDSAVGIETVRKTPGTKSTSTEDAFDNL